MLRRFGRASVAAVLLGTLLIPAVGSSADTSRLDKIRSELDQVRGRLAAKEAAAETVEDKVNALNEEIVSLRSIVGRLDERIATIESEVRSVQARIDRTQKKIDKIHDRATKQAVTLYKSGATDTIDALLDSQSLAELDSRVEMLGVAASENTDALIQYGRLRVEVQSQFRELFQKKTELTATRSEHTKALSQTKDLYERHRAALEEYENTIGRLQQHEGSLETAEARITGQIQEIQAKHAAESLGTSSQGFIWPLNGSITSYYGERWGRMHTGIDIDGYTGQMVVASKAGRVVMATYYSGYGNCVVIDHGGGYATLYAHLSSFDVSNGQDVGQGQVVGRVGCTGSCTGDHLHFEVRVNGNPVDPLGYLP